jgi:DNA-binding protein H-NS
MANINLNDMSLAELKSLQKDVEKAIADYTGRKKTEAMAAREAREKVLGFSLAELTGLKKTRKSSGPTGVKYRHPEVPEVTWSGCGLKPGWFSAAIEAGRAPEWMAV